MVLIRFIKLISHPLTIIAIAHISLQVMKASQNSPLTLKRKETSFLQITITDNWQWTHPNQEAPK